MKLKVGNINEQNFSEIWWENNSMKTKRNTEKILTVQSLTLNINIQIVDGYLLKTSMMTNNIQTYV